LYWKTSTEKEEIILENPISFIQWLVIVVQAVVIAILFFAWQKTKAQAYKNDKSGLPNNLGLEAVARPIFGHLHRGLFKKITIAAIDLDDFSDVNNRYGHKNGDKVLEVAGKILLHSTRPDEVVGHLQGDEFVIIFIDTPDEVVLEIMKRARKKFAQYHFSFAEGDKVNTNFTFGIASTCSPDETFDTLYHNADMDCNARKELPGGSRYNPLEL